MAGCAGSTPTRPAPAPGTARPRRYARQERLEFRAIDAAIELAAIAAADRLVDLATGTGLFLRRLAGGGGPPAGRGRRRPLAGHARTRRAAARRLVDDPRRRAPDPLPDGSADVVTCRVPAAAARPGRARRGARRGAPAARAAARGSRLVLVTPWADPRRPGGRHRAAPRSRSWPTLGRPRWAGCGRAIRRPTSSRAGFVVTRRRVLPRGGYPVARAACATVRCSA